MWLIPKNQIYKSEAIVKTVVAPIVILIICACAVFAINPFTNPQTAAVFGMSESGQLAVTSVEQKDHAPIGKGNSWNCAHWIARGTFDSREMFARACIDTNLSTPKPGESLDVAVAPAGSEAYLLARGKIASTGMHIGVYIVTALVLYGVFLSLRLMYIGYSSNWSKKT